LEVCLKKKQFENLKNLRFCAVGKECVFIKEGCYTCTLHPPSSSLYNKKIGLKEKVVFDVTLETTFFLKSIFLREKGRQRGDEWCISSISPTFLSLFGLSVLKFNLLKNNDFIT
jgi:hypothetical protein